MEGSAHTWHYGVVARWWAEFNQGGPEIAYFQRFIEDGGEPALDVGCGTGRLLIPFLRAGLDVDGCDVSADMIALCREQVEREGLSPTLVVQPMYALDLPRRYRTIFVCGAFGLGSTRDQDLQALERFFEHLEPGGTLVLDNEVPYSYAKQWRFWLKDERAALPEDFPPPGERRRGADGAEYELRARTVELDPLAQRVVWEMSAAMWREGELEAEELHALTINFYFGNELLLMLERAGFSDVAVYGDHSEAEATGDNDFLVYVARKRA